MVKQKKNELTASNWIVKSNALNEIKNSRMTISQIRLFAVYLSKVNPNDVNSREVAFKLDEYSKIMQFTQTNTTRIKQSADDLLRISIVYTKENDGSDEKKGATNSCDISIKT